MFSKTQKRKHTKCRTNKSTRILPESTSDFSKSRPAIYQDSIRILSGFYQDSIRILSGFSRNISEFYRGRPESTSDVPKSRPGFYQNSGILQEFYQNLQTTRQTNTNIFRTPIDNNVGTFCDIAQHKCWPNPRKCRNMRCNSILVFSIINFSSVLFLRCGELRPHFLDQVINLGLAFCNLALHLFEISFRCGSA